MHLLGSLFLISFNSLLLLCQETLAICYYTFHFGYHKEYYQMLIYNFYRSNFILTKGTSNKESAFSFSNTNFIPFRQRSLMNKLAIIYWLLQTFGYWSKTTSYILSTGLNKAKSWLKEISYTLTEETTCSIK